MDHDAECPSIMQYKTHPVEDREKHPNADSATEIKQGMLPPYLCHNNLFSRNRLTRLEGLLFYTDECGTFICTDRRSRHGRSPESTLDLALPSPGYQLVGHVGGGPAASLASPSPSNIWAKLSPPHAGSHGMSTIPPKSARPITALGDDPQRITGLRNTRSQPQRP